MVVHFVIECPKLFKSRDDLLQFNVNCSFFYQQHQCDFILGNRNIITLNEDILEHMMIGIVDGEKCRNTTQSNKRNNQNSKSKRQDIYMK